MSEKVVKLESMAGKYMVIRLADEVYGIHIQTVRELIQIMEITRVPRTADYVRGVINLRGKVIPVMDLKQKLGMDKTEINSHTVIIVVQYYFEQNEVTMGLLVDEVLEVMDIKKEILEPTPYFGNEDIPTEFIAGLAKAASKVVFILNIQKVLDLSDHKMMQNLSKVVS